MSKRVYIGNNQYAYYPDNMPDQDIESQLQSHFDDQKKQSGGIPNRTLFDDVRDFIYGVGKAGEGVAKTLYGNNMPAMPDIRQPNPSTIATTVGQYLPFAYAGGASLLGSTLGAGAYGATQFDPHQHGFIDTMLNQGFNVPEKGGRTRNAIEDAMINAIFHGIASPISKMLGNKFDKIFGNKKNPSLNQIDFKNNVIFPPGESEFTNLPFKAPSFLSQNQAPSLSGNIAGTISTNIMGNRNLEQSGKELASHIHNTYQNIKDIHSNKFNQIFDTPTDISVQTGEPILVKDRLMHESQYRHNNYLADTNDKNIALLNKKYMETPSVENGHNLQSELGSEIGYLKKQRENGMLDGEGKNRLNNYIQAQNAIHEDIRQELDKISPKLQQDYDAAREEWRKNVIPYHYDKDLRSIAEGRVKNPEAGQIISIFKNPEENINKVKNDLNPDAKDRIAHIALGTVKEDLTPEQLLSARRSLDTNGMSSYISPENEQLFRNLRSNLQLEKERQTQEEAHQVFLKGLQKIQKQSEAERIAAAKTRAVSRKNAYNESNQIMKEKQKDIETVYQQGLKEAARRQQAKRDFFKKIGYATLGVVGAKELGLNATDIMAAYLAARQGKK